MMYAVTASVTRTNGTTWSTRQIPTFYLNCDVQGITDSDHARKIAKEIVDPFNECEHVALCVILLDVGRM